LLQVTVFTSIELAGGTPDVLLAVLVAIALLRGSVVGAASGFCAGLLVDTATLGTLGVTSLLLTVVAYWAGRYGETTGRGRRQAPLLSVAAATVVFALGAFGLHVMLGDDVSARLVFVDSLLPSVLLNLLVATPVFAACSRMLARREPVRAPRQAKLAG